MAERGDVTLAHDTVSSTATSAAVSCVGYNCLLVAVTLSAGGSPNWTITVNGAFNADDTAIPWNQISGGSLVAMTSGALTTSKGFLFTGVPDYVTITATENSGTGTCAVEVQPVNVP
jgi:hypothetical protein